MSYQITFKYSIFFSLELLVHGVVWSCVWSYARRQVRLYHPVQITVSPRINLTPKIVNELLWPLCVGVFFFVVGGEKQAATNAAMKVFVLSNALVAA